MGGIVDVSPKDSSCNGVLGRADAVDDVEVALDGDFIVNQDERECPNCPRVGTWNQRREEGDQ